MDFIQVNNNENLSLNNLSNNKDDKNKINFFQKMEFLNYLHFCGELLRPPNGSILTINMRFSSLEYKFNSLKEIPNKDFCIDLLFNALEISVIIKLFTALLFEKHIIIISNQNLSLFCIAESLKLLLFPLRWPHIYIPNLPYEFIKYLESPTPYLMGINSPLIDVQSLIEQFPSNIICDVSTSSLYGNLSNLNLPLKEENRIKSKLLKLKSKYINNYDDIDYGILNNSFYSSSKKTNSLESNINIINSNSNSEGNEDIDYEISFGQNVQNIFFNIFKNNLSNIKNEYISGNIFNSQKFINSFNDNEYKYFFEKLIKTLIFEDFLMSLQYSDDSFSRQYNNIINENSKNKNTKEIKNKYYLYEIKTQKNIKENSLNQKDLNIIKDYNEISYIIEKEKNNKQNDNYLIENKKIKKRYSTSFKQLKENNQLININRTTIKSIKGNNYIYLNFYGKNSFISFYKNYYYLFSYNKIIYKEINQIYEEISLSYSSNSRYKMMPIESSVNQSNIDEDNFQDDNDKLTDIPVNYSSQLFIIIGLYLFKNIIYENDNNINENSISSELSSFINTEINENINGNGEIKKVDKNLNINDEIANKNNKNIKRNNLIINLFIRAFKKNQNEFPRNIFFTLLNNFSLEDLKNIEKTNIKYIDKTIQFKIDNKEKKTYKSMVINIDSDIEESTEDYQQLRKLHTHKISDDFDDIALLDLLNNNLQNKNNLSISIKDEEVNKKEEKKNFKKTKINVIDNNFNSFALSDFQNNNSEITKKYLKKLNKFNITKFNFNSFPDIGDNNSHFYHINLFSDPMALCEKICLLIYNFLCSVKIENYNVKNYDINFFKDLAYSEEFEEIKSLIISLKNISLENLSVIPKNYYCFWLNIFNFLTIFSVIFKCEIISNNYEWYRFLKNSYFEIGNLVISLYEIETYILRGKEIAKRIYTNIIDNSQFRIKEIKRIDNNLINYGISLPTISSPIIRIYYPFNFMDSLKINAIEFFSRNINYNTKNQNIEISEYPKWIDTSFEKNLANYKNLLPKGIFNFLKKQINIDLIKYDWKLTFVNFKNLQNNK